jgi:phospho-N-acetylmuramoyl-pentapeptide-transferase
MGNVTSMALGGALATIALATGTWLLLPLIGIVYVAEVLSDIIQVGYFKWTGGKRVFRMAPLHHHFELGGMHETAVTRRFWLAGAVGGALAVGFVYWATWGMSG